jgi:two-component system chemotaxis response regulator CheY
LARKILLADDSVTAQNMGRKILTDAGYEVSTVNNGSAALKKIAELKPDLIVLDVYMPGYSGLEVCQRLKEARETARIPVLLTVGKLEPFKPEEARRARADGFIIKPFEASELLVALTKLEDKIVPQPEPYKPGRFAKAIAAVEQFKNAETGEDFGDSESGWKNRIQFPSAAPKATEPEPEVEIPPAGKKGFRDLFRSERKAKKAEPEFERPLPAGVPPDITSEEIAAIAAAAAKVGAPPPPAATAEVKDRSASPAIAPGEPVASQSKESVAQDEAPPVTFASAAQFAEERPAVSETRPLETKTESGAPENMAATPQAAPAEKTPETKVPEPAAAKAPDPEPSDAEVMAALQSLDRQESQSVEPATASVPAQSLTAVPAGPRWIADAVTVSPEESALRLEDEMERAYAAASPATFASTSSGTPAAQHDRPQETAMSAIAREQVDSAGPASSPAAEPAAKSEPAVEPVVSTPVEAAQPEPAKEEAQPQASSEPAKELQLTEEKIKEEAVAPATQTEVAAAAAEAEPTAPTVEVESSDRNPATTQEEAAEAAPVAMTAAVESTAIASSSEPAAPISKPAEPDHEVAKTAAAWASWQQVHETVSTTQGAEEPSAAQNLDKDHAERVQDEAAKAAAQVEKEVLAAAAAAGATSEGSASPSNDTAIASIVEGVLAELKPRLVEEIAKKLKK